ncbi:hypothetical protein EI171_15230 [Bradyrhizobium sp. LCT2]|nr:hypothetical protein EI171_15230 [Bradyrhizobium sp. LCT2]
MVDRWPLDHAEHDGADEGHGEVRGDHAQSPGERHAVAPKNTGSQESWLPRILRWRMLRCSRLPPLARPTNMINRKSRCEKVSLAVAHPQEPAHGRGPAWLRKAEINTLKSL